MNKEQLQARMAEIEENGKKANTQLMQITQTIHMLQGQHAECMVWLKKIEDEEAKPANEAV